VDLREFASVGGIVAPIRLSEADQLAVSTLNDEAEPERVAVRKPLAPLLRADFDTRASLAERGVGGIPRDYMKVGKGWDVGCGRLTDAQVTEIFAASQEPAQVASA
jgi:hypothetical protein